MLPALAISSSAPEGRSAHLRSVAIMARRRFVSESFRSRVSPCWRISPGPDVHGITRKLPSFLRVQIQFLLGLVSVQTTHGNRASSVVRRRATRRVSGSIRRLCPNRRRLVHWPETAFWDITPAQSRWHRLTPNACCSDGPESTADVRPSRRRSPNTVCLGGGAGSGAGLISNRPLTIR